MAKPDLSVKVRPQEKLTLPLKWHGGKNYLAPEIVKLMPPRCKNPNKPDPKDPGWLHYVEPYFGGGAVLLANDPEGISEVANDINFELTNFWNALRDEEMFSGFMRDVQATPFSQVEYLSSDEVERNTRPFAIPNKIEAAAQFFICCRQSLAGRMKGFTGITRKRTRRGMNAEVSAWLNCIEGLPAVHERLKRVLILNQDAIKVIRGQDETTTLFYCDPPYLHETRSTTGEYEHEMTTEQHQQLLETLTTIKGRFLLSGYPSNLYCDHGDNNGWTRHEFDLPNNAASGKSKERKTECLWTNY